MSIVYQKYKRYLIIPAIIIGLSSFLSIFWVTGARIVVTKASVGIASFSVENSYLFATPLQAQANAQEEIRVTLFILNDQGLGISGKKVSIEQKSGLVIKATQSITDSYGKSEFDISSSQAGEFYLTVSVDGTSMTQKAHLSFIK